MPDPRMGHLFGLFAEEGDEIVSVLALLQTTKGHLRTGNVFLRVLEVLELHCASAGCDSVQSQALSAPQSLTSVSSSQVMPFCLFASV